MRIRAEQILLKRVISCLRLDRRNPEHLHVEFDALVVYLDTYGLPVPPMQYEALVKKMLREQVKGLPLGEPYMIRNIAKAFIELAMNLIAEAERSATKSVFAEPEEVKKVLEKGMTQPTYRRFMTDT